jgi:Ca2+-binding EF-hand superfamily protein
MDKAKEVSELLTEEQIEDYREAFSIFDKVMSL